ncbi:hypothetical protein, partial [Nocardia brasiliensis]|uniref:hypothetical protein n=1 Tax=Nocardia brasiliensis TaxID=37326 RepID=UPI00245588F9
MPVARAARYRVLLFAGWLLLLGAEAAPAVADTPPPGAGLSVAHYHGDREQAVVRRRGASVPGPRRGAGV